MNRRDFIKISSISAGGILLVPACTSSYNRYLFLSPNEADCLIALCEQIISADENGPGATDAGVVNYIDKQLVEVFTWEQAHYKDGLKSLQNSVNKIFGKSFQELDYQTQTNIVEKMEANTLPSEFWKEQKSSKFLELVITHTKQGFYGSPRHGGNKNYMSYKMLDFDYPLVIGQNRY